MKAPQKIAPEDYILAALSPKEKLEAALQLAREAFKNTPLTPADVERAIREVRKKNYAAKQKKSPSSR